MKSNEKVLYPFAGVIGFSMDELIVTLGSELQPSPGILLKYPGVSRRQAKIFFQDGTWYVEDLGSDNGSWVISSERLTLARPGNPLPIFNRIESSITELRRQGYLVAIY